MTRDTDLSFPSKGSKPDPALIELKIRLWVEELREWRKPFRMRAYREIWRDRECIRDVLASRRMLAVFKEVIPKQPPHEFLFATAILDRDCRPDAISTLVLDGPEALHPENLYELIFDIPALIIAQEAIHAYAPTAWVSSISKAMLTERWDELQRTLKARVDGRDEEAG